MIPAAATIEAFGGLNRIAQMLLAATHEVDVPVDVRLRVFDGQLSLHFGDAQSDTDHRGYWGAGTVSSQMTTHDAEFVASDMIDQILEAESADVETTKHQQAGPDGENHRAG